MRDPVEDKVLPAPVMAALTGLDYDPAWPPSGALPVAVDGMSDLFPACESVRAVWVGDGAVFAEMAMTTYSNPNDEGLDPNSEEFYAALYPLALILTQHRSWLLGGDPSATARPPTLPRFVRRGVTVYREMPAAAVWRVWLGSVRGRGAQNADAAVLGCVLNACSPATTGIGGSMRHSGDGMAPRKSPPPTGTRLSLAATDELGWAIVIVDSLELREPRGRLAAAVSMVGRLHRRA